MKNQKTLRRQAEQLNIVLPLPIIKGNQDYNEHKNLLERIDQLLVDSGIEAAIQENALAKAEKESAKPLRASDCLRIQKWTSQALRCQIARVLSVESFREFAFHAGESHLLQKFCRLINFDRVWVPSKSTLQEYSGAFPESEIRELVQRLNLLVGGEDLSLGLSEKMELSSLKVKMDLSVVLLDSTCVELPIHFPVDWVLLRDAVRSLTKAIECIRRHGLKCRMTEPKDFRTQMNRYCMAMTQAKKGEKARKIRKKILRSMKKLNKCVASHAKRYRDLLKAHWAETELSEKEATQIMGRIDNILTQLPQAIHQAHERIIGGRLISNNEKILSLYESHSQVYHRGKAGATTEFGLQLVVGESMDGLIVDWELVEGAPKNDTQNLKLCIERLKEAGGRLIPLLSIRSTMVLRCHPER